MLRSLFSGISGLRAHQTMMDVVGNNIANVNSVGYKSSNVVFEDTLSQMLRGSTQPTATAGGLNPVQVGLGVKVAAVSTNFGQGSTQLTGRNLDLMIQGDGFFVVKADGIQEYTRAGSFTLDSQGRLTTPDGALVQGWSAVNGVVNPNAAPGDITLPLGTSIAPTATSTVTLGGNVDATAAVGAAVTTTITAYDGQGTPVQLTMTMTKTAANTWDLATTGGTPSPTSVAFDPATGKVTTASPLAVTVNGQALSLDIAGITQFGGSSSFAATKQDGAAAGQLQAFNIGSDGTIVGVFSNGLKQPIAQLAMASFSNPGGLEKAGNSSFLATLNSGAAVVGAPGTGDRGLMVGGALEMSNVDLGTEFTNLIIAQRGFQANSKIITSGDEILQDLVNLKR
jgi:flagellar hook protein FlgE